LIPQQEMENQLSKSAIELNPRWSAARLIDQLQEGPVYRIPRG